MGQTAELPLELLFKRLLNEKRNQISNNEAGQIPDKGGFPFVEQGYAPLFKHLEPLLMLLGFFGHIFKYLTHGYGHLLKGFKPLGLGGYVSYIPGAASSNLLRLSLQRSSVTIAFSILFVLTDIGETKSYGLGG